jgi:hypothetical protein
MRVIAYPNRHYPPATDALDLADTTLAGFDELDAALLGPALRPG